MDVQLKLNSHGMASLVIKQVRNSPSHQVFLEAVLLGVALLNGGNKSVQVPVLFLFVVFVVVFTGAGMSVCVSVCVCVCLCLCVFMYEYVYNVCEFYFGIFICYLNF